MAKDYLKTYVDVHLFFRQKNAILLLLRQNTGFADGDYHVPAGHLEPQESVLEGAIREAREETGVVIDPAKCTLVHTLHQPYEGPGRVGLFFETWDWTGEITNVEPDKCLELKWFDVTKLPQNMVPYCRQAIECTLRQVPFSTYVWDH